MGGKLQILVFISLERLAALFQARIGARQKKIAGNGTKDEKIHPGDVLS